MGLGLSRSDLRLMAQAKIDDAIILLQNKRWSNARYLAGYSIELSLKACIAAQITAETIPDSDFVKDIFVHDFNRLVGLAGLRGPLRHQQSNPDFAANWAVVSEWRPETRYEASDPISAQTMIEAITDSNSGVLPWIKVHW